MGFYDAGTVKAGWRHILPLRDSKPHQINIDCTCDPAIDWSEQPIVHKAFDFREVREFLRRDGRV